MGFGRSGSTALARAVADELGALYVGELAQIFSRGIRGQHMCACGQSFGMCPLWSQVVREPSGSGSHLTSVEDRFDRLTSNRLSEDDLEDERLLGATNALLRTLASLAHRRVIVDSSKLARFTQLIDRAGIEVRPIHLVRHPAEVAAALAKRKVDHGDPKKREMARLGRLGALARWVRHNEQALALRRELDVATATFDDLRDDPQGLLSDLLRALPIDADEEEAVFHDFSGNPARIEQRASKLRVPGTDSPISGGLLEPIYSALYERYGLSVSQSPDRSA